MTLTTPKSSDHGGPTPRKRLHIPAGLQEEMALLACKVTMDPTSAVNTEACSPLRSARKEHASETAADAHPSHYPTPAPPATHRTPTAHSPAKTIHEKVIAAALAEVGRGEKGHDNRGADVSRYKSVTHYKTAGLAWCADFASYILQHQAPGVIKPTSSAQTLLGEFKQHHAFHSAASGYKPEKGDLVFFAGAGHGHGHVGFWEKQDAHHYIHTVEGNAASPMHRGHWNPHFPDRVREIAYSPETFKHMHVLGYGALDKMTDQLGHLPKPVTPVTPQMVATKPAIAGL